MLLPVPGLPESSIKCPRGMPPCTKSSKPGMPVLILPLIIVVEILGLFTKPFALCIRLFANMIAGHVVILSLLGLIFILQTVFVAPVSIAFAIFIYLLELLVALIQAYIFTMLSSLFIGMAVHQEH